MKSHERLWSKCHKHHARAHFVSADPITPKGIRAIFNIQSGCCYYCKKLFELKLPRQNPTHRNTYYHIEHKTPIYRGGTSSRYNIVLACADCNMSKGIKTADEFMAKPFKPTIIVRKQVTNSSSGTSL